MRRSCRPGRTVYPLRIVLIALFYFALVFGAGLAFEAVQIRAIEPAWGVRVSELVEAPVMMTLILAAGWVVARAFRSADWQSLFVAGIVASVLDAFADVWMGALVRGQTPAEILFKRDSVEGAIYYFLIGLVAIAPAAFGLGRATNRERHAEE